jgi:hypothetical protein
LGAYNVYIDAYGHAYTHNNGNWHTHLNSYRNINSHEHRNTYGDAGALTPYSVIRLTATQPSLVDAMCMNTKTVVFSLFVGFLLTACSGEKLATETPSAGDNEESGPQTLPAPTEIILPMDFEIVTLLPFDAIPSIDEPRFYDAQEADQEYEDHELVIGVEVDGQARAYPIDLLSSHEIVNDTIAGHPIAVTW